MKKLFFIPIILFLVSAAPAQSQRMKSDTTSWHERGFDFMVAGGVYFGNKYNAAYYNGSPDNENGLDYLFNNKYYYDEINKLVLQNHPYISDSVFLGELPQNMKYSPSMAISFGFRYKFNKNWGINFSYSFSKLTATDMFTLVYRSVPGNYHPGYLQEYLVAKENRSMFDLSASYLFNAHPVVKPFLELGLQFNFVKVKKFIALIEEREFELLDYYNGVNYVPGIPIQEYNTVYGGPGYGMTLTAGIKLAFNKYISIDPTFYLSASSVGLTGYKNIALNYGAFIRVIMSDHVFMK